ncbi:MAG: isoleucine--tRNA ligase [Candidatus Poribacteria bacterium]|nr:MAG: isoleucine--tRNA ligase [Candidatus Poribacteria bacterium]
MSRPRRSWGTNVSYLPNWNLFDPNVELDIAIRGNRERRAIDPVELRRACIEQTAQRLEQERQRTRELGIFADWRGVFSRLESRHEARMLDYFGQFLERGYLRKEAKPSYWCVECQSVLTEEELLYRPRKSNGAYVLFPVRRGLEELGEELYLLVWVPELWTLPAAVAVTWTGSGQLVAARQEDRTVLMETQAVSKVFPPQPRPTCFKLDSETIPDLICAHPLTNEEIPVVFAGGELNEETDHPLLPMAASTPEGGYPLRVEYNYRIVSIVDDEGHLTEEAGSFCGIPVSEASQHIALQLKATGLLAAQEDLLVNYPHCWICEQPAVFRPADQWFFDAAHQSLRLQVQAAVRGLAQEYPPTRRRFDQALREARGWTASQQRVWSLPVPAFYCQKCGTQLDVERSVKAVRDFIAHRGTDAWFHATAEEVLPNDVYCPECGAREFRKDTSTVSAGMLSLIFCLLNLEGRRETAAVGDIFLDTTPSEGWYSRLVLSLFAAKGHLPTQFLHFCHAEGLHAPQTLLDRPELWELLDRSFGVDLLRLLILRSFPEEVNPTSAIEAVQEEAAAVRRSLAYVAAQCEGASLSGRITSALPPLFQAFAQELEQVASSIVESLQQYRLQEAWEQVHSFLPSLERIATVVAGLRRNGRLSNVQRLQMVLAEWFLITLKLVTPFLPTTGEHLWRRTFASETTPSIFLVDWNYPFPLGGKMRRRVLRAGEPSFPFPEWAHLVEALLLQAAERDSEEPILLIADDAEWARIAELTLTELEALVHRPVRLLRPEEATATGYRLSELRNSAGARGKEPQ